MAMSEFYLTLPSNTHIGNKTCEFRVHLPDVIKLSGEWDVALAQIQYPKSWNNLTAEKDVRQAFHKNEMYITIKDKEYSTFKVAIPAAHYDTIDDMLGTIVDKTEEQVKELVSIGLEDGKINKEKTKQLEILKKVPRSIFWSFDPVMKRVTVKFNKDIISVVRISEQLKYMLGFQDRDLYNWEGYKDLAKYPIDMRGGVDALYVYCDLVENQVVGNVREPLLRILPVQGFYGEIVDKDFVARHYIPILKKEFSTVHISIKSDRDILIPFSFGKVIVKLHFRSRSARDIHSW